MAQAFRAIGEDASITLTPGGPVDGSPSFGTGTSVTGKCRSATYTIENDVVDVSGFDAARFRPGAKTRYRFECTMLVDADGLFSLNENEYVKVEYKPMSSFASALQLIGIVERITLTSQLGQVATYDLVIVGPADYTTT